MFRIGETYRNRVGAYEVTDMSDGWIYVRYENGATAKLSIEAQERIIQNIENEENQGVYSHIPNIPLREEDLNKIPDQSEAEPRRNATNSEDLDRPSPFTPLVPAVDDDDGQDTEIPEQSPVGGSTEGSSPPPPPRRSPRAPVPTHRAVGNSEATPEDRLDRKATAEAESSSMETTAKVPGNASGNSTLEQQSSQPSMFGSSAPSQQVPRYFVFGLGGTGVKIVDQARRSEYYMKAGTGSNALVPRTYDYLLADTSEDVRPDNPDRSHTFEGVDNGWFLRDSLYTLADRVNGMAGGAARVPPIGEFAASKRMDAILRTKETSLDYAQTTFLFHSGGGGTGSGLAPWVARRLRAEGRGGKLISLLALHKTNEESEESLEIENAIYNFPRINSTTDLVIVIDNRHVSRPLTREGSQNRDIVRYARNIEANDWVGNKPSYIEGTSDTGYILADRYAYRVMTMLTNVPGDIGNNLAFFQADPRYSQGARWAVPYLYPMDMDYETDYRGFPPAAFVIKALANGGLAHVVEGGMRGRMALVIMEIPEQYRATTVAADVKRVLSEVLDTQEENVRVLISKSPVDGIAVGVFLLNPLTKFLDDWYKDASGERKDKLLQSWQRRVSTLQDTLSDSVGSDLGGLSGAWAGVARALAPDESVVPEYEADAIAAGNTAASFDICTEFVEFAKRADLFR